MKFSRKNSRWNSNLSVLSGPNLASEIIEGMAAACVIAAKNKKTGKDFLNIFDSQSFKVFLNNDVKGVELGALKNIYAIVSGLSDGLGNKKNTKAMILTRSLVEMSHLFEGFEIKKINFIRFSWSRRSLCHCQFRKK